MTRTYSLAYLTSAPLAPPDAISLAAEAGYGAVGLRALAAVPGGEASPLMSDAALRRETIARAKATGVSIFDVEIVRIGADFSVEPLRAFLETCGELGAKAVLVAMDEPEFARQVAAFAAFCDTARPYGLTADLEFMPWTKVPDAKAALRVVEAADRPNGGVLVDTLHAARSRSTLADLAAIPAHRLNYAQICDAPAEIPATVEGLLHTARHERLLPGAGGIALKPMLGSLAREVPVSIELPNDREKASRGVPAWAKAALAAARDVLEGEGPA